MATALLSVSDKTHLVEFALGLAQLGWRLLATGGTASAIRAAGIAVEEIADYTGSPEVLEGRVKTLHPAVHGGILARLIPGDQADLESIHARMIDLVVVNLYPFQETVNRANVELADAIESIDIGGVALIRAAAKNFQRVTVITDPGDYALILAELRENGQVGLLARQHLAVRAFQHTARYDSAITAYLTTSLAQDTGAIQPLAWLAHLASTELRYGENPHQSARLYHWDRNTGPLGGQVIHGKDLSYNNLLDLDSAWRTVVCFERPTVSIIKHVSPCGVASAGTIVEAFRLAFACDAVSAFGGVIAANQTIDIETVDAMGSLFVECIAAPDFSPEAFAALARRRDCRLLRVPDTRLRPESDIRTITHGLLWQERDYGDPGDGPARQVVTSRQPTGQEWDALQFAWKACMHVKSNAIVLARGEATVGIGGGQPNRADSVRIAVARAGERSRGAVMASDAFLPFRDSVDLAAQAGVTAIVQPGGSVRDNESIAAANAANIAMVATGIRHFRH
jgi:phosphoribosylaminoimidazolecarboxamide formyltransferase/IMP cyclohydrolase